MVFSSHLFLFYFLPLVLALYYGAPRSWRMFILTLLSYGFYGWTNPWFIVLLMWSTIVDFVCGNFIYGHWRCPGFAAPITAPDGQPAAAQGQRKLFVTLSLLSNLGMLGFFKYFMFAEENLNDLLARFGKDQFAVLSVLLPAGISFYTFESISYNLDIYFGLARPASAWVYERAAQQGRRITGVWARVVLELRSLNAFACYITQFPHLVAGPIIRYQDLEKQLHDRPHTVEKFARGVAFLSLGMAKKVLLANPMGDIADAAFGAGSLHWFDAWYGVVAYAFQLYFDFSGYSDMAIGLALMFGFVFPKNFDSPYLADSITDFWRRWHISLSTWLRDYLYIPLGGNRVGEARTYFNLLVVMVLGGFWHGASWNFLIWGAIHGGMLAFERTQGKDSPYRRLPRIGRVAITFAVTCVAWVFFRAKTLDLAGSYCASMVGLADPQPGSVLMRSIMYDWYHLLLFAICAVVVWGGIQTWDFTRRLTPARAGLCFGSLVVAVLALWTQTANPFLYFQF
ncbi:MAG: MBOAT family protein [Planctomycetes bacterium]|nr:MBOAT family protein [Planctomycetota bacterium]